MKFGLSDAQLATLREVLARCPAVQRAMVFGSRAMGNHKEASDIDLALFGPLKASDVSGLKEAFEESYLPFFVDVVAYDLVKNAALREHIDKEGVELGMGWRRVTVDSIKAKTDNAMSTGPFGSSIGSAHFQNHGVPVLRGSNLSEDVGIRLQDDDIIFLESSKAEEFSRSTVEKGDLIFTCWGTVGQVGLIDESSKYPKYVISNKQMKLTPDPSLADSQFLYYLFSNPAMVENIKGNAIGSSVPGFNLGQLKSMEIELPPVDEQKKIVEVIGSIDDKIQLLQRQNKTLEKLAECAFQSFFGVQSPDWPLVRLDAHTNAERGLSYKGSGLAEESEGVPMHNLNSIYEGGGYKYSGIKWYTGEYKERHILRPGDLIVANTEQGHEFRLIGFPAMVPDSYGPIGIFSQHLYKLSILPGSPLTPEFLFHLICSSRVREQVVGATNGSTVNMLAIDGLQATQFELPPEERIESFTIVVRPLWAKGDENRSQIHVLTKTRDSLLPKLMNGEVRVAN